MERYQEKNTQHNVGKEREIRINDLCPYLVILNRLSLGANVVGSVPNLVRPFYT